ncbi:MAG: radical SAM family heme chaperone HemW [Phycisphaeraceae bacterium]
MQDSFVSEFTPLGRSHQAAGDRSRISRAEGLYIHVPFCFHKCHYCDFYSIADRDHATGDKQARFVESLRCELRRWADKGTLRPRTVFIGGGTPTLLRVELWDLLLGEMDRWGVLGDVREFTVEANPETLTPELARTLRRGGVNRLSIGCQSFQPELLNALERWHDPESVGRAVRTARAAGIDNINLDLIFAIPGQSLEQLRDDLGRAVALEPDHLSYYGLTYEPNTTLAVKLRLGRVSAVGEELELAMYQAVLEGTEAAGFEQYETSNFARPGRRCEHNLVYWRRGEYLGLGPSASSHLAGERWKNQAHLGRYVDGCPEPPVVDRETLTPGQQRDEALMLGLRLREGIALSTLDDMELLDDARSETIARMIQLGYVERTDTHLRLTRAGLPVADGVIASIL